MSWVIKQSEKRTCPGGTYVASRADINVGQLISLGFQNSGNAMAFYASQNFVDQPRSGYIEVVNNSLTSTDYWVWYRVWLDSDEDPGHLSIRSAFEEPQAIEAQA